MKNTKHNLMTRTIIIALFLGGLVTTSSAQTIDWQPTLEDFVESYDSFPGAEAVMILDHGKLRVGGNGMVLKHTSIIHLLKESGRDLAEINITYNQRIHRFKIKYATSYHVDESGQVVETRLEMRDVIQERIDDETTILRANIPNARIGSIIKYEVEESQDFLYAKTWTFQQDIPVLTSEFDFKVQALQAYTRVFMGSMKEKFANDARGWYQMNNLPAAKKEPFVSNHENFRPKLYIQSTAGFERIRHGIVPIIPDWETFGNAQLKKTNIRVTKQDIKTCATIAEGICNASDSQEEKARKLYRYVQQEYTWNQENGWFPDQSLKEVIESKTGHAGEINHLLFALLVSVGIDARMALVGTTDYSFVIEYFPVPTQFNVMMVYCQIGDKRYALDATDPHRQFELPARNQLNGKFFILEKNNSRWEKIPVNSSSSRRTTGFLNLREDGTITGTLSLNHIGYQATTARDILESGDIDDFWEWRLAESFDPVYITSYQVKGLEDPDDIVTVTAQVTIPDMALVSEEYLYLQPLLIDRSTDNPFKEKERMYPIDFSYPFTQEYRVGFTLPQGYLIEEAPEDGRLLYRDNEMSFLYRTESAQNIFNIMSQFVVRETSYPREDILLLREMFDEMITRHGQQVVLKKITE